MERLYCFYVFSFRLKAALNAVQVSSATLKDGTNTVFGLLQVVSGVSKTLTCETSVSRPAATIVWYIGREEKQRSICITFTFNPQNSDHYKQIYCKAFNTQTEIQAVTFMKSTLIVQVNDTDVDFYYDKTCYAVGEDVELTAMYTWRGIVTAVEWSI